MRDPDADVFEDALKKIMTEDSPDQVVERARRFAMMINWVIDHIENPDAQFRIIHRTNYDPGTAPGKWMAGYFVPTGGGNGEWWPFRGHAEGATMFDAVERFYLSFKGARHDPR
ncbi:MAG: hypothetical protein V3R16_09660 [Nitrospirales bacterium]